MGTQRAQGKDYKTWFIVKTGDAKPAFLEGQSSSNESFKNATQTVSPLKVEEPSVDGTGAVYEAREDGKRDVSGSVSFSRLKNDADSKLQQALLNKLKHAESTRVTMFSGYVTAGPDSKVLFTGYKTDVLISEISADYPGDSEVTGTVNWENAGGEPIDIIGKEWSEAISQIESDPIPA